MEDTQAIYLNVDTYKEVLGQLRDDESIPCFTDNLIYLTKSHYHNFVERDILYSILEKGPKRAKAYWFVSIHVEDVPYKREYEVENFGTDYIFRVRLNLGFKENPADQCVSAPDCAGADGGWRTSPAKTALRGGRTG